MKAPREPRPHIRITADPQRQPHGLAQRRVDASERQRGAGHSAAEALPAGLQHGLEALSGQTLDDVRVHRNSAGPAQLEAAAYAQGRDIHLAPGQDHHLPHEAWHVVQQRQGRVRATTDVAGVPVNDNAALEREADTMGRQAVQRATATNQTSTQRTAAVQTPAQLNGGGKGSTEKRKKERRIKGQKQRPDNRVWLPSGEIGVGDPPEGFSTWHEWIETKKAQQ